MCGRRVAITSIISIATTTSTMTHMTPTTGHAQENPHADDPAAPTEGQQPPRTETKVFSEEQTFADLGLSEPLLQAIEKCGYKHPTKVQSEVIPVAIEGRDVLGQSQTGTGKTAAFALPMLQQLSPDTPFGGLILCPTRELAIQVTSEVRELGRFTDLKIVTVYGGQPIRKQAPKLKRDPHIIVGTPGRVMDFHKRGLLPYDNVKIAVLDEVDRMLDIGFRDDIRKILGSIKHKHQTIFVSATISDEIERLTRNYLNDPARLAPKAKSLTVEEVTQKYFLVQSWDKKRLLVHLLKHEGLELTLVFCRTKNTVDALCEYLQRKNIDAQAIHGDLTQSARNRVMKKLRDGELSVLIASDLAARGLDVNDITHVINYDLPDDPEIYVHRIGRTARAGRKGIAWSFVTPEEGGLLSSIERLTNAQIDLAEYDDFEPGPVPETVAAAREKAAREQEEHRHAHSRVPLAPPPPDEAKDAVKFPGGKAPVALQPKRLGGRVRTKRK